MSVKVILCLAIVVFSIFVNSEVNVQYKVENSYNDTEQGIPLPEVIEQGGDNNFEDTAMGDGLTTPPVTEAVTPNITTKPTWIQRIPKKKTKQTGT